MQKTSVHLDTFYLAIALENWTILEKMHTNLRLENVLLWKGKRYILKSDKKKARNFYIFNPNVLGKTSVHSKSLRSELL